MERGRSYLYTGSKGYIIFSIENPKEGSNPPPSENMLEKTAPE